MSFTQYFTFSEYSINLLHASLRYTIGLALVALSVWSLPRLRNEIKKALFASALSVCPFLFLAYILIPTFEYETTVSMGTAVVETIPANTPSAQPQLIASGDPSSSVYSVSQSSIDWILLIWAAGVFIFLLYLLTGSLYARSLTYKAIKPASTSATARVFARMRRELEIDSNIILVLSDKIHVPFTTGIFSPRIVLPEYAQTWDSRKIEMVLTHELTHIKQNDTLWQAVINLGLSLQWFNPIAWLCYRHYIIQCEIVCDNAVIHSGHASKSYGNCLLDFLRTNREPIVSPLVSNEMATKGTLENRLTQIADSVRDRSPLPRRITRVSSLLLFSLLTLLGGFKVKAVPTIQSQDETPSEEAHKSPIKVNARFIEIPATSKGFTSLDALVSDEKSFALIERAQVQEMFMNLQGQSGVVLIASPTLNISQGREASIQVTQELKYQSYNVHGQNIEHVGDAFIDIGPTLRVTPTLGESGNILISARGEITALEGFIQFDSRSLKPGYSYPTGTQSILTPRLNRQAVEIDSIEIPDGFVLVLKLSPNPNTPSLVNTSLLEAIEFQSPSALRNQNIHKWVLVDPSVAKRTSDQL